MNIKKKLYRHVGIAAVGVLVSAVALYGLVWGIAYTQASIAALSEIIAASSTTEVSESILERQMIETRESRDNLDAYFLNKAAIVPFLEEIENLARASAVSFKVVSVSEEKRILGPKINKKKVQEYGVVTVQVSFEGQWTEVFRFHSLLEHIPYASRIERIELNEVTQEEAAPEEKIIPRDVWSSRVSFTVAQLP